MSIEVRELSGETTKLVEFHLDTDGVPGAEWFTELLTTLRDYIAENDEWMVYSVHFTTDDDATLVLNAVLHSANV